MTAPCIPRASLGQCSIKLRQGGRWESSRWPVCLIPKLSPSGHLFQDPSQRNTEPRVGVSQMFSEKGREAGREGRKRERKRTGGRAGEGREGRREGRSFLADRETWHPHGSQEIGTSLRGFSIEAWSHAAGRLHVGSLLSSQPGAPCTACMQTQSESGASLWPFTRWGWAGPSPPHSSHGDGLQAARCLMRDKLPMAKGVQATRRKDS